MAVSRFMSRPWALCKPVSYTLVARWIALPLLLATTAMTASAQTISLEQRLLEQLEQGSRVEAYAWLRSIANEQAENPAYYDWLSRFAMEQGDYANAIPALEKLIAMDRRHMGARLDLVIALQLEGRSHEAREQLIELNERLAGFNHLPDQARQQLAELNKLLLESNGNGIQRGFSGLLSAGLGYDSNANRGADEKTITVQLPGGLPFDLELAPESLKTSDEFTELALHTEYGDRGTGCRFESCRLWVAGASTRHYASLDEYDQRQLYLGTRKSYGGKRQREYTLMVQNVVSSKLDFDRVDEQNILGLEYRQRIPGFSLLGGAIKGELIDEVNNDSSTSLMSTLSLNGVIGLNINPVFNHTNRKLLWEAGMSWHERPDYFAGNTQRLWLSANYPVMVLENWQGNLGASYRWREDTETFSEIFFGTTSRQDNEWQVSATLQRALGKQWLVSSRAYFEQVDSNIPLFDVNRFQVSLALAWQF